MEYDRDSIPGFKPAQPWHPVRRNHGDRDCRGALSRGRGDGETAGRGLWLVARRHRVCADHFQRDPPLHQCRGRPPGRPLQRPQHRPAWDRRLCRGAGGNRAGGRADLDLVRRLRRLQRAGRGGQQRGLHQADRREFQQAPRPCARHLAGRGGSAGQHDPGHRAGAGAGRGRQGGLSRAGRLRLRADVRACLGIPAARGRHRPGSRRNGPGQGRIP